MQQNHNEDIKPIDDSILEEDFYIGLVAFGRYSDLARFLNEAKSDLTAKGLRLIYIKYSPAQLFVSAEKALR